MNRFNQPKKEPVKRDGKKILFCISKSIGSVFLDYDQIESARMTKTGEHKIRTINDDTFYAFISDKELKAWKDYKKGNKQ